MVSECILWIGRHNDFFKFLGTKAFFCQFVNTFSLYESSSAHMAVVVVIFMIFALARETKRNQHLKQDFAVQSSIISTVNPLNWNSFGIFTLIDWKEGDTN